MIEWNLDEHSCNHLLIIDKDHALIMSAVLPGFSLEDFKLYLILRYLL